jgi:AraC-like DNA-binding protein
MDVLPSDYSVMQWSSRDAPRRARLESWRDLLTRKLLPSEVQQLGDGPFRIDVQLRALPALRFSWGAVDASHYRRTRSITAGEDDDFVILVNLDGEIVSTQNGHEVALGPGDACLMACTDPGVFYRTALGRVVCIRLPSESMAALVPRLHDRAGMAIPRDSEALHLLTSYIHVFDDSDSLSTPELRAMIVTHIHNLAALTLRPTPDNFAAVEDTGLRAARLRAIKSYILENLNCSDLTVGMVAAYIRVSPRYVQMLMETDGTTFSEFALHARLERVYVALTDERTRARSIGDVAFENGFGNISYFSRAFRRRFGASPSEIRNQQVLRTNRPK